MKAQELRIGNLITIENQKAWPEMHNIPVIISAIESRKDKDFPESTGSIKCQTKSFNEYSQFDEFIQPIPLTEEWLLKFGFHLGTGGYSLVMPFGNYSLTLDPPMSQSSRKIWNTSINWDYAGRWITGRISFVHQLQNLYFALTGSELTIKKDETI